MATLCNMSLQTGPLLQGVLDAQAADDAAVTYPAIAVWVDAVLGAVDALGGPVLWPVGFAAERVAGAVVLAGAGRVRVWSGRDRIDGERVAILALNLVGSVPVRQAARAARALGASGIDACVGSVEDLDLVGLDRVVQLMDVMATGSSLHQLTAARARRRSA